jgi:ADP-ribose pyrophosphatase YjhB (NUDIX family)
MMKPIKRSVAVLVRRDHDILAVRRSDDDDELPGVWGLPAGTLRPGETVPDVIRRIGRDKLGVKLLPIKCLAAGEQERLRYRLEMELWEVSMEGTPNHPDWQWNELELLRAGKVAGSLCCELAIKHQSRVS